MDSSEPLRGFINSKTEDVNSTGKPLRLSMSSYSPSLPELTSSSESSEDPNAHLEYIHAFPKSSMDCSECESDSTPKSTDANSFGPLGPNPSYISPTTPLDTQDDTQDIPLVSMKLLRELPPLVKSERSEYNESTSEARDYSSSVMLRFRGSSWNCASVFCDTGYSEVPTLKDLGVEPAVQTTSEDTTCFPLDLGRTSVHDACGPVDLAPLRPAMSSYDSSSSNCASSSWTADADIFGSGSSQGCNSGFSTPSQDTIESSPLPHEPKISSLAGASHKPNIVVSNSEMSSSPNLSDIGNSVTPALKHEEPPVEPPRKRSRRDKTSCTPNNTSTRRSQRHKEQYYPLGPRHLEYDYDQAVKELNAATVRAVYAMGFQPRKRTSMRGPSTRSRTTSISESPADTPSVADILAKKFPDVEWARRMVDAADCKLQEALARGETWENTAVSVSTVSISVDLPTRLPRFPPFDSDPSVCPQSSASSSSSTRSGRCCTAATSMQPTVASTVELDNASRKTRTRKRRRED
ncbi:unnamed protein product [Somion occarium]|uniref:Uncharacterized protein n=1 Tax=Somion occarium TaxID=3059160 RepID=A0ABP1E1H0_9APHY